MIAVGRFFLIFIGSVIIEAITGLIVAFILKRQSNFRFEKKDSSVDSAKTKSMRDYELE